MENQIPVSTDQLQLVEIQKKLTLDTKIKNSAGWFFWIAGLSILNTILYLTGAEITFVLGLGATQVVDGFMSAVANEMGGVSLIVIIIQFVIDLLFAGVFIFLGILGRKRKTWAIIVGIVFYSLDALLTIAFQDYLGFGFHIFAIVMISGSLKAIKDLTALELAGNTESIDSLRQKMPPAVTPKQKKTRLILAGAIIFIVVTSIIFAGFVQ